MVLRNLGILAHHYTASQNRIPRLEGTSSPTRFVFVKTLHRNLNCSGH